MARDIPAAVIGSFQGEIITVEWVPDPKVVEGAILRVANYLDDMAKPLMAARAIAQADMKARFDMETDPEGNAWTPLDPEYLVRKQSEGSNEGILKRWDDLEKAATAPSAFIVNGDSLFFSSAGLPFYWSWHQEGTGPGGSRALGFAMKSEAARKKGLQFTGTSHESQDIGRGLDTPARPFIGLSAEAEVQIFEVFDLWFAEGTSIAISGTGTVQERISGRFGKKMYPDFGSLVGQ